MGALWVETRGDLLGGEVGIAFVLSFASLFGGALISPKLRTPGVWIVALLAVVVTSLELVLFEKFAGQLGELAGFFSLSCSIFVQRQRSLMDFRYPILEPQAREDKDSPTTNVRFLREHAGRANCRPPSSQVSYGCMVLVAHNAVPLGL